MALPERRIKVDELLSLADDDRRHELAAEVLSPSDRPADAHAKIGDYLAAGCPLVWLIDPASRKARLQPYILGAEATLDGENVLPGFRMLVRLLLAELS